MDNIFNIIYNIINNKGTGQIRMKLPADLIPLKSPTMLIHNLKPNKLN